jgi:hypothetical protein
VQGFSVIYSTSVDIASDLMIMALPISLLPSLHLDFRRKVGLGIAFSLGLVIMSVAIVRMTKLISGGTRVDIIGLAIWGAIEPAVAVIVGCLLPLKALISRSVKDYNSARKSSRYAYAKGHLGQGIGSGGGASYGNSVSRTVMVTQSILLDDVHRSNQKDGAIYVQRSYEMNVELYQDSSSRDDEEVEIVKGHGRAIQGSETGKLVFGQRRWADSI